MTQILERQYLSFTIDGERYALSVGRVREVLEYAQITRLPGQLPFMKGLIDLRGKGVPVVDLRSRFGLRESGATRDSSIIVAELGGPEGLRIIGLLVDAVHEVVEIEPGSIDAPPSFGARGSERFVKGIAKKDRDFLLILDAERLLDEGQLGQAELAAQAG